MTTAAQRAAYTYSYVEPHPSVPVSQKLSTGRGGAGNATRLCSKTTTKGANATGPASRTTLPSPSLSALRVGRGGAGNIKGASSGKGIEAEPTVFELDHDSRHVRANALDDQQRIWHYGRGGQGNVLGQRSGSIARKSSDASSMSSSRRGSVLSSISGGSERGGERRTSRLGSFVEKIRRTESNNQ